MYARDWRSNPSDWRWILSLLLGVGLLVWGTGHGLDVRLHSPRARARVVSVERRGRDIFTVELLVAPPSPVAGSYGATAHVFPPSVDDEVGIYVTAPALPRSLPGVPSGTAELASLTGLWCWAALGGGLIVLVLAAAIRQRMRGG